MWKTATSSESSRWDYRSCIIAGVDDNEHDNWITVMPEVKKSMGQIGIRLCFVEIRKATDEVEQEHDGVMEAREERVIAFR